MRCGDMNTHSKENLCDLFAAVQCFTLESAVCRSLGYNDTGLPNVFGQTLPAQANALLDMLMSLVDKQCSDDIKEFACAASFPQCTALGHLLHPCRDFCFGESLLLLKLSLSVSNDIKLIC